MSKERLFVAEPDRWISFKRLDGSVVVIKNIEVTRIYAYEVDINNSALEGKRAIYVPQCTIHYNSDCGTGDVDVRCTYEEVIEKLGLDVKEF